VLQGLIVLLEQPRRLRVQRDSIAQPLLGPLFPAQKETFVLLGRLPHSHAELLDVIVLPALQGVLGVQGQPEVEQQVHVTINALSDIIVLEQAWLLLVPQGGVDYKLHRLL
jgi:hypothetical protein